MEIKMEDIIEELNLHAQLIDDLCEEDTGAIYLKAVAEIRKLRIELAGKEAVIKELEKDVAFYKRYQTETYAKKNRSNHKAKRVRS